MIGLIYITTSQRMKGIFMLKKVVCLSACLLAGSVVFAAEASKSAQADVQNTYVIKPSLAEQVLKIVISDKFRNEYDKFQEVPLEKLPPVCKEACDELKEIYGNEEKTASVAYIDLDNDGSNEMIVTYRHYWGNGGTAYDILTQRNGKWIKGAGFRAMFWQPLKINGRFGLLLDNKCGGGQRNYSFCEFKNGKLIPAVSIDLERYFNKEDHRLTIQVHSADEAGFNYLF